MEVHESHSARTPDKSIRSARLQYSIKHEDKHEDTV